MEIAGILSGQLITTGGGSGVKAKRREVIYEKLGGVTKKKAPVPHPKKIRGSEPQCGASRHQAKKSRLPVISTRGLVAKWDPVVRLTVGSPKTLSIQDPGLLPDPVAGCLDTDGFDQELFIALMAPGNTPIAPTSCSMDVDAQGLLQEPMVDKASENAPSCLPLYPAGLLIADDEEAFLDDWDELDLVDLDLDDLLHSVPKTNESVETAPPALQRSFSFAVDL
jgi:hypothetical protein